MKPYIDCVWKDIVGFEGLYEVSNTGLIRRTTTKRNKAFSYGRYATVHLYKNSVCKAFTVRRLVAKHFIGNPDNKPEVNHIDEDTMNNRADNLEWVTRSENALHSSYKNRGELSAKSLLSEKEVKEIVTHLKDGLLNQHAIAELYGVSNHTIHKIKVGANWGWLTGLSKEGN